MYQLGWFSTGRDKAARDLLQAANSNIRLGEIEAEIAFVFCNHEPDESKESDLFFKLVEKYHIPLVCFSFHKFKMGKEALNLDQKAGLPLMPITPGKSRSKTTMLMKPPGADPFPSTPCLSAPTTPTLA